MGFAAMNLCPLCRYEPGTTNLWCCAAVHRSPALLPIGEAVFVDVDVVVLDAPQLLREHVRVFAVAAGAVGDDRLRLLTRIAALFEELVHFLVDVGLPHRERPRAGD